MRNQLKTLTFDLRSLTLAVFLASVAAYFLSSMITSLVLGIIFFGLMLLCFNYRTLGLGGDKKVIGENINQYALLIKVFGAEPKINNSKVKTAGLQSKNTNPEIKVFTFGLFVLEQKGKVRAGFIKRHQVLIKA